MDDYRAQFAAMMRETATTAPPRPQKRTPTSFQDKLEQDYRRMVAEVNRATEHDVERALLGHR